MSVESSSGIIPTRQRPNVWFAARPVLAASCLIYSGSYEELGATGALEAGSHRARAT